VTAGSVLRAVAIVCARNEEHHIRSALRDLIDEGLDVVLIDHASSDRTVAIARQFLGRGLLSIEGLAWTGRFSLTAQLEAKSRAIERLDHDWIVHVDADEWLSGPDEGQTLIQGLREADAAGYNAINFNGYIFVPRPGENLEGTDFRRHSTRYYFFQPRYPFLVRAWKNGAGLDNRDFGGHLLSGNARLYPRNFPMRHYIFLSEAGAERKYLDRVFDEAEVARGWHRNKLRATKESLRFPNDDHMFILPHWSSKQFDASTPFKEHYWEWALPGSEYARVALDAGGGPQRTADEIVLGGDGTGVGDLGDQRSDAT
jgi:glycosyltransferase involved in cell wall biosynthesis